MPGANLSNRNLTMAYLIGADLTKARMRDSVNSDQWGPEPGQPHQCITIWRHAHRREPDRGRSAGGEIFVNMPHRSGFTATQLYSTASYQAHDLTGIGLVCNNLTGANLAGQNLTNARLEYATLTNASFSQANLTNASLSSANLTGANLTGADVRGGLWTPAPGSRRPNSTRRPATRPTI